MSLKGKIALVTGSASGLGKASVQRLSKDGAAVVVADLNLEGAKQVAEEINSSGGKAIAISMDVTSEEDVNNGFKKTITDLGGIDIVFSNAGIQIVHPIEEFPFAEWKKMMAIHADGAFLTAKAAFTEMKKSGKGGQILFMGSAHSHLASPFKSPYCFAKHGLLGLARVLAKEGGEFNIHTYVVCPGFVRTPLVEKQIPEQAKIKGITEEEVISTIMLKDTVDKKFTTLEEVANLVSFFAHDEAGVMTGQSLLVSHGWGMC